MIKDEARVAPGTRLRTLLCVDDNPGNLKLVELFMMRRPDMRLLTAVDGKSGLEIAWVSLPEVIVTDINLPDMSGFKILEILRADPATAHIPVIALSANSLPLNVESGLEAGFFRYLTKPILASEFLKTLDMALAYAEKHSARITIGEGQQ
jgi:CheY-like chemotaxis protein